MSRLLGVVLLLLPWPGIHAADLVVSGKTVVIDSPRTIDGSVIVENGGTLIIRGTTLTLRLNYDEEHRIEVSGSSRLVVEDSVITSTGGQYWIELFAADGTSPKMDVSGAGSWITNHAGIRPFNDTVIRVTGGDVEELQVHDRVVVQLSNAAVYPVFFFDGVSADITSLATGDAVSSTITTAGGWSFSMTNATVKEYQIDLVRGARVSLSNGDGIVLSIRTPGDLGNELRIVENVTSSTRSSGSITNLGSEFYFTNSAIPMFNVYVSGNDRVLLRGLHVNEANAEASSELIIGQKGFSTALSCNLCQVYDNATMTIIGSTIDDSANVPSATASSAGISETGRGVMSFADMDLRRIDLTARDQGTLNLFNCSVDEDRLSVLDATATVNRGSLRADFTATRLGGRTPLTVSFLDLSAGEISSWSWDFGDGSTSTQQAPAHVYWRAGTYGVRLTVTDPIGSNTRVREGYIVVAPDRTKRRAVRR